MALIITQPTPSWLTRSINIDTINNYLVQHGAVMLQDVNVRNQNATYSINVPYDVEALLFKKKGGGGVGQI